MTSQESAATASEAPVATDKRAMAMVSILFVAWGFITVLNDILIPHLKNLFQLDYAEVMLVQFSFFGSYFVVSQRGHGRSIGSFSADFWGSLQ